MIKELNVHFVLVHLFHRACTETAPYDKFTIKSLVLVLLPYKQDHTSRQSLACIVIETGIGN